MNEILALLMQKQAASGLTINDPGFSGTLAYYTLGNISGTTLVDETAAGNDVTIPSGVTTVTDEDGSGLQFHGHPEELVPPFVHDVPGGIGFEMHFKFTGYNASSNYLTNDENGSGATAQCRLSVRYINSTNKWYVENGNGTTKYYVAEFNDTLPAIGTMIHLVGVLEANGQIKIYRDNVSLTQTGTNTNNGGPITPTATSNTTMLFGPKYTYTDRSAKVKVYKMKFFDFPPTAAQVAELYAARNNID